MSTSRVTEFRLVAKDSQWYGRPGRHSATGGKMIAILTALNEKKLSLTLKKCK